jgi:hypothetical protein
MEKDKLIYASAARKAILKADPKLAYCIDSIPGVDAVEVVPGKWIDSKGEIVPLDEGCPVRSCNCSVCGEWLTASDEYACVGNYCPNCGAKMDGGNEDG